jgi:hypothetical protein
VIVFRARRYGSADWTRIAIHDPLEEDSEASVEADVANICGSALGTSPLHVQRMSDEGEWEDVE